MNVGSTIAQSILLTFFWMIFAYAGRTFSKNEPPQAIIVPAEFVEIELDEEIKELPESMVARWTEHPVGLGNVFHRA